MKKSIIAMVGVLAMTLIPSAAALAAQPAPQQRPTHVQHHVKAPQRAVKSHKLHAQRQSTKNDQRRHHKNSVKKHQNAQKHHATKNKVQHKK